MIDAITAPVTDLPDTTVSITWHDLGLPRARFGVRRYASGRTAYVVRYYSRSMRPSLRLETLPQGKRPAAYAEAVRRATRWHQGLYDPWEERPGDTSLEAAAEAWFRYGEGRGWTAATVRGRRGVLNLLLADHPRRACAGLTAAHVRAFLDRPALGATSRASYLRVLTSFFKWCKTNHYLDDVPTEGVQPPRERRTGIGRHLPVFTPESLERFCEAAESYYAQGTFGAGGFIWIVDLVRFAVATGLRKGELRHLRWADVDMREGKILVRGYEDTWRGEAIRFDPKCGSERVVPIYPMAREVLRRRHAMRLSESESEPVFLGPRGKRLGSSQINRAMCRARREAGLPETLTVHATRHTFASWLLSAGVPIYRVSKMLGHRSISLTITTYGKLMPMEEDAGERVFSA